MKELLITFGKKSLGFVGGKICETLIPIKHQYYMGRRDKDLAICTLSSINLLDAVCKSSEVMSKILVVGRLLSENKGIDTIIRFTLAHPQLHCIVVCGIEVRGHQAGQALLSLYKNGININCGSGIIIGAKGPHPVLTSSQEDIDAFRKQIKKVYDLIGITDIEHIKRMIEI